MIILTFHNFHTWKTPNHTFTPPLRSCSQRRKIIVFYLHVFLLCLTILCFNVNLVLHFSHAYFFSCFCECLFNSPLLPKAEEQSWHLNCPSCLFLCLLCASLLNNTASHISHSIPPQGCLPSFAAVLKTFLQSAHSWISCFSTYSTNNIFGAVWSNKGFGHMTWFWRMTSISPENDVILTIFQ